MEPEHELSPLARQRMAALLPELLTRVRSRRHRRLARRSAVAALAVVLPVLAWHWRAANGAFDANEAHKPPTVATMPSWVVVHDDPSVLARCSVTTPIRRDWLLTDDELQAELQALQRPIGLLRVHDQVLVCATVVDPWPSESPGESP